MVGIFPQNLINQQIYGVNINVDMNDDNHMVVELSYLHGFIFVIIFSLKIIVAASSHDCPTGAYNPSPLNHVRTIYRQFIWRNRHAFASPTTVISESSSNYCNEGKLFKESCPFMMQEIAEPLVQTSTWNSLTGYEFYCPTAVAKLADMGIKLANPLEPKNEIIEWKAESSTKILLNKNHDILRAALKNNTVLTWRGIFSSSGYGSNYPVIRTHSLIPMSPYDFTKLIMDSSRVHLYNKYSLGRKDIIVLQRGVHTSINTELKNLIKGEAKIVRNKTHFPWKKNKTVEAITFMYARPLEERDKVREGILSLGKEIENQGYIVVSRALNGGKLSQDKDQKTQIRSEILLGINLVRSVAGDPNKSEVTTITQVKFPLIPPILAGKMGVKCALDFIYSIRAICI